MKWISVTDSLPGYNKCVLFVHNGCVYAGSIGPSDVGLKFYHAEDCFEPEHITDVRCWMPYPEPPNSQPDERNDSALAELQNWVGANFPKTSDVKCAAFYASLRVKISSLLKENNKQRLKDDSWIEVRE